MFSTQRETIKSLRVLGGYHLLHSFFFPLLFFLYQNVDRPGDCCEAFLCFSPVWGVFVASGLVVGRDPDSIPSTLVLLESFSHVRPGHGYGYPFKGAGLFRFSPAP